MSLPKGLLFQTTRLIPMYEKMKINKQEVDALEKEECIAVENETDEKG